MSSKTDELTAALALTRQELRLCVHERDEASRSLLRSEDALGKLLGGVEAMKAFYHEKVRLKRAKKGIMSK